MGALAVAAFTAIAGAVMQHDTNQRNKGEAQKNRDFQLNASSTAHQRQVRDLRAAGLNPLLSSNAGSSSPSGATAQLDSSAANVTKTGGEEAQRQYDKKAQSSQIGMQAAQTGQALAQAKAALTASEYNQAAASKAKMETAVMSKDLPRAEIMNKGWNAIKDKMNDWDASNASKDKPKHVNDYMQKFNERVRVNAPR